MYLFTYVLITNNCIFLVYANHRQQNVVSCMLNTYGVHFGKMLCKEL